MKKCVIGLFAHVDAGKTTLSESILFTCGELKKQGRVDHKDAFLDYDSQEKDRGITIYSKEARFNYGNTSFVLLDTPGHSDLSGEMERCIAVLDIAVLIISASEGVQAHTFTIWNLLKKHRIPTAVFVNKMDISYNTMTEIMDDFKRISDHGVIHNVDYLENVVSLDEELLDRYLNQTLKDEDIKKAFLSRKFFPVITGSALKNDGTEDLLKLLDEYSSEVKDDGVFKARVYKISRDENKERLTHMKITGGRLKVKTLLRDGEKADQIRLYSGRGYKTADEVSKGDICAIKGLKTFKAGDVLGEEETFTLNSLEPYMSYDVVINDGSDPYNVLQALKKTEDESPEIKSEYNENTKSVRVKMMGTIQIEVVKNILKETYGIDADFISGRIDYKETVTETSEGIGHYEPLRHYAEVHLLLEPLERGSGIKVESAVSLDDVSLATQNLILRHLNEKKYKGVLTGNEISDVRISLLSVASSLKHTSMTDLYEATDRAVRHGLMNNESVLLEPFGMYELEISNSHLSKAVYDLEGMKADYKIEEKGETCTISGRMAMRYVNDYSTEVISYTHGQGRFTCIFDGYDRCLNEAEVIEEYAYNPERDIENPCGSIFFANGAGYAVSWRDVAKLAHLSGNIREEKAPESFNRYRVSDEEVKRAFESTSPVRDKKYHKKEIKNEDYRTKEHKKPECVLVDGYNVIFADERLKKMAEGDLQTARYELINKLCDYKAMSNDRVICVFDAYKVETGRSDYDVDGVNVVFTKEKELADHYIERRSQELMKDYHVSVVTSDSLEQAMVFGHGAMRISSETFLKDLEHKINRNLEKYGKQEYANRSLEELKDRCKEDE